MRRFAAAATLSLLVLSCVIAGQQRPRFFQGSASRSLVQSSPGASSSAPAQTDTNPTALEPGQTQDPNRPTSPSGNDLVLTWGDVEKQIWATAKPYLDENLPQLEARIPELEGIEPAPNQDALQDILTGVGAKCVELLHGTPNVIADEQIKTYLQHVELHKENVGYLVVVKQTPSSVMLNEYRTDKQGTPISNASTGQGFATMWEHFFPANQAESRYRYLGKQKMDGRDAVVVAFAQIPDKVKFPAHFVVQGARIDILYQGVAWIDASDWRILRVREDLLAPRPDAKLTNFSARVEFGAVTVKKAAAALWLPKEADLEWVLNGQSGSERHVYSNYRLYMTKSKIILTP
jgi:hypothetical protein